MSFSRNKKIAFSILFAIIVCGMLIPVPAQAFDTASYFLSATGITSGDSFPEMVLKFFLGLITVVKDILLGAIIQLGNLLNWVVSWKLDTGGEFVAAVWKTIRDICNMAFIVVIILTSFGTIFGTFGSSLGLLSFYNVYNKKLLASFFIAAISMNFSLAIGQTIIAFSNQVTDVVVGILPTNIGGNITHYLRLKDIATNGQALANVALQPSQQSPNTSTTGITDEAKRQANKNWENQFLNGYLRCVREIGIWEDITLSVVGDNQEANCYKTTRRITGIPYPEVATADQRRYHAATGNPPEITKINGLLLTGIGGDDVLAKDYDAAYASLADKTPDLGASAANVMGNLYTIFLLLVLALSMLVPVIFMVIRIPVMWFILAVAPIAWIGYMTPGQESWKNWWKQFIALNIFSPLYLMVIYFGLYLLSQQDNLLAHLGKTNPVGQQIGMLLFYIIVGFVMVGGAAAVFKLSYFSGTRAGAMLKGINDRLGIKGEAGAIGAIYRKTGMENQVNALRQRGGQIMGDTRSNIRGRLPNLPTGLRSQEEAFAAAQKRAGVRGGDQKFAEAIKKRIDEQQTIIKGRNLKDDDLQKLLTSGNRDARFAAGEILLGKGKLSSDQIKTLADEYGKVSPTVKGEFSKRVAEQTQKEARKTVYASVNDLTKATELAGRSSSDRRKFLESVVQGETGRKLKMTGADMLKLADLLKDNVDDQRAFLETATKSGRNKVAAIETLADAKLLLRRDGTPISAAEALEERAKDLSDLDLLDAEEHYKTRGEDMPKSLQEKFKSSLRQSQKFAAILKNVSGPEQQLRILDQFAEVKRASAQAKSDFQALRRIDRKYGDLIKQLKQKLKKSPSKTLGATIDKIQARHDKLKDRMAGLRKITNGPKQP